jgi:hypothetical protein
MQLQYHSDSGEGVQSKLVTLLQHERHSTRHTTPSQVKYEPVDTVLPKPSVYTNLPLRSGLDVTVTQQPTTCTQSTTSP